MKKVDNDMLQFIIGMSILISTIFMGLAYLIMTPANYDYFIYAGVSSLALILGMVLRVVNWTPAIHEYILKEKKQK